MNHLRTIWRRFPCVRSFCSEAAEPGAKKRYRPKNLLEVASYLPERGLGAKFTRLMWIRNGYKYSYWTISKVLEKSKGRLRYYGRLTWKGVEDPRERPVRTWQKRGWRYVLEKDMETTWDVNNTIKPKSGSGTTEASHT